MKFRRKLLDHGTSAKYFAMYYVVGQSNERVTLMPRIALWARPFLAVLDIWNGLFRFHYPPCCVLRFALDTLRNEPPALMRGSVKEDDSIHVPCGIFHQV